MAILDGKKIALELQTKLKAKLDTHVGRKPCLGYILVGSFPPSQTYVRVKKKACAYVGIQTMGMEYPQSVDEKTLLEKIAEWNLDSSVDAILIQLPLPPHIDEKKILFALHPDKDVDGFHPINVGKMSLGDSSAILPCTPLGIKTLLEQENLSPSGKHVVIMGRSNIVGKPLASILMQDKKGCNASVTVLHSKSENIKAITLTADILVVAIGKPKFVTKDMVKQGTIVIDVGINRLQGDSPKIVGDVDFDEVAPKASYITPVPGGVGPMTVTSLLYNVYRCYSRTYFGF